MQGQYQVRVREVGDDFIATGRVSVGDFSVRARVKISAMAIQRMLHRAMQGWEGKISGYDGDMEIIGWGFFKKLYKKAKSVVKKVKKYARKIAQSKVLGKLAKTFRDPRFMAAISVIPGIGPVAAAGLASAGAAWGGLQAMTARRKGQHGKARRISLANARRAKRYGLSSRRFNRAQRYGAGLSLNPRMMKQLIRMLRASLRRRRSRGRIRGFEGMALTA